MALSPSERKWKFNLRHLYKITEDDYTAFLQRQDYRCAICETEPTTRLQIDHDHQTGRVRGLLCQTCNRGLGLFHDNIAKLKNAIKYLGSGNES
jgi:hypothetical protein